jgi:hypothetical protein
VIRLVALTAALVAAPLAHAQPLPPPGGAGAPATTVATAPAPATPDPTPPAARPLTQGEVYGLVFLGGVALLASFFPAGIAALRGHRSTLAIFAVCLFFGWTCLGWVVALVWSLADTGRGRGRR